MNPSLVSWRDAFCIYPAICRLHVEIPSTFTAVNIHLTKTSYCSLIADPNDAATRLYLGCCCTRYYSDSCLIQDFLTDRVGYLISGSTGSLWFTVTGCSSQCFGTREVSDVKSKVMGHSIRVPVNSIALCFKSREAGGFWRLQNLKQCLVCVYITFKTMNH